MSMQVDGLLFILYLDLNYKACYYTILFELYTGQQKSINTKCDFFLIIEIWLLSLLERNLKLKLRIMILKRGERQK